MRDATPWAATHAFDLRGAGTGGSVWEPASVQPHGFVVCLDDRGRIVQASENVAELARRPLDSVLGAPLDTLTGADAARRVADAIDTRDSEGAPLYVGTLPDPRGAAHAPLAIAVHRRFGVQIVEFEPSQQCADVFCAIHALVSGFIAELHEAGTTDALAALAVRELRRLTGFGRVLLIRFDGADDAHVIAEDKPDGDATYLDRHFPVSAIPKRAREQFRLSRIRVVADTRCSAANMVPTSNPATGAPADLSFATLRGVSAAHRQWLERMGARASLSMPIVVRGKLWGSLACQDERPRVPPIDVRIACETIGQVLSLRLEASEERAQARCRLEARRALARLIATVAEHDQFVDGLLAAPQALLDIASACGAAIVFDGRIEHIGVTPDRPELLSLADWLGAGRSDVFATECLADDCPVLRPDPRWAGMMAVSISKLFRHYVMWFRPGRVRTIRRTDGSRDVGHGMPHDHAHDALPDAVATRARPGGPAEMEVAGDFRAAMLGVVLKRAEETAQLATDLGRANKELEAFSYSVSHDLRAPLRHIVGYGELLAQCEAQQLSERGLRFLENIIDSARFAGTLVDDLLTLSQMGRAALRPAPVAMHALFDAAVREQIEDAPGRDIDWRVGALPEVIGDAVFLQLAVRNLVANAVKYTRTREHAVIEIGARTAADEHVFFVRDNGVGFDMKYAGKLFGVFQRLHRAEDFEGTGIGLANVRRVIERHDGRTWAEGAPERGATFFFTLPRRPLPVPDE